MVRINTPQGTLCLEPIAEDAIRVRMTPEGAPELGELIFTEKVKAPKYTVERNGGDVIVRTAKMSAVWYSEAQALSFLDADDTWHPEALRLFSEARLKTGADVVRYGWRYVESHPDAPEPLSPAEVRIEQVDVRSRRESTIRFCALGAATVVSRAVCGDMRFSGLTQGARHIGDVTFYTPAPVHGTALVVVLIHVLHSHAGFVDDLVAITKEARVMSSGFFYPHSTIAKLQNCIKMCENLC